MNDWEVASKGEPSLGPGRDNRRSRPGPGEGARRDNRRRHGLGHRSSATVPPNLYEGFSTIAATIVQQLDGALDDGTGFEVRTLAEFALVLAVITLLTNVGGSVAGPQSGGTALPVGRGV